MSLSAEHVKLLRGNWAELARDPHGLTSVFYETLFRIAPEVKPLFAGTDLPAQQVKLAAAIGLVVKNAQQLEPAVSVLANLGRRHRDYGVTDAHYDAVGTALISAIAARLGPRFTPTAREAWLAAYAIVASAMQAGAAPAVKRTA